MDSDDPEQRIRELERQLANAKGGPRENVPVGDEAGFAQAPGMMAPPPPGANPPSYDRLRRQMNRRRRISSFWGIFLVPGILLLAILVFHPYRAEKHSTPSWSGATPTADLSSALTVGPGGNLTQEPSGQAFTVVCDQAELTIAGNANAVYVAGHCAHLIVKGSHNKVVADNADAIDTDGSRNQVIYHSGVPLISVRGTENLVKKG
jgi:Protein of unknown function (DUF3060)